MLDAKKHRLDYGKLLAPPGGYRLDRAVATTYSADLTTLLSIPVALVYAQTLEGDLTETRFQLLEAIRKFSQQVKIYHQKGQLPVPRKLNWLHAYLEDALSPILMDDAFSAFHPKVWIIRYAPVEEGSEPIFRVIALSRNLTMDRSWDVAAFLEGQPGKRVQKANTPLLDFVRWLDNQDKIEGVEPLLAELARVDFPIPWPFTSFAFHPMGIPDYREAPYLSLSARRGLVLSPFLHPDTLAALQSKVSVQLDIFSSRYELEKLSPDLLQSLRLFHLNEQIIEGEFLESAEEGEAARDLQKQDLHAKLFMFDNPGECTWFLGSANATKAASERNIEFMMEFKTSATPARTRRTLIELLGENEEGGPFVAFDLSEGGQEDTEEQERQTQSRLFKHALLQSKASAWLSPSENGLNHDLHVRFDLSQVAPAPGLLASVQPFNTKQPFKPFRLTAREVCEERFENLSEVEISRFLRVRIEDTRGEEKESAQEFLWKIDIEGLPADRLENILRKIIDSPDKFFDYLRFLLADEITKDDLLQMTEVDENLKSYGDDAGDWGLQLPIYEQLLVTAARCPSKLIEVDEIIRHLTSESHSSDWVIPETFLSFWEVFRTQIPNKKGVLKS